MTNVLYPNPCKVKTLPQWTKEICFGRLDNWFVYKTDRPRLTVVKTAADFIHGLATDSEAKKQCRAAAETGDDAGKRKAKGCLPFWSITGAYAGDDAPQSTFAQLDFDKLKTPDDARRAKEIIVGLGCALIVSYSASGKGVFAVVDTGGQYDKATLKERYLMPVYKILMAQGIETTPDDSTLTVGVGRLEGFDADPYVSPTYVLYDADAMRRQAAKETRARDYEKQRLDNAAFYTHPIHDIAAALRDKSPVGGIATAAALAFIGSHTNVFSRRYDKTKAYAARAFIVVLSRMGAGKTTMIEAIADARMTRGTDYILANPRSDAALAEILKIAGTNVVETFDGKRSIKRRLLIDPEDSPKNSLFFIDEAGKFLLSATKNEKCGDMDSALCKAFDAMFTPPMPKSDLGEDDLIKRVQANATLFMAATPAQWIQYAATENESNGMMRRRLVFMDDTKPIEVIDRAPSLKEIAQDRGDDDIDAIRLDQYSERLAQIPKKQVFVITERAYGATQRACQALHDSGISQDAWDTLICNYATLCAAARCAVTGCTRYEVTEEDMAATTDILIATVCKTHGRIAAAVEMAGMKRFKSENEVWADIREFIGDGKRKDRVSEWLNRRPPIYKELYSKMNARGEFVEEQGTTANRAKRVRLATDEERELYEVKHEKAAHDARLSVFDGNTGNGAASTEYRCDCYYDALEMNGVVNHAANDNSLRAIAGKIKASPIYRDDPSGVEQWFKQLVKRPEFNTGTPYTDRDAARLFRDGNLTKIAK